MKRKIHILHLFLTLGMVCFITAAPNELLDIYIVDEAGVYSVILEFSDSDVAYVTTEKYVPPTLKIGFANVLWTRGDFQYKTGVNPLYQYSVREPVSRHAIEDENMLGRTNMLEVRLDFNKVPDYRIELKTDLPEAPRNIMVISWPKKEDIKADRGPIVPFKRIEPGFFSINFKGADLVDVIRLLSEQHELNLVLGEEVTGKITLRLNKVPLEKALDLILKANGYTWFIDENILLVKTADGDIKHSAELETRIFQLYFLDATMVITALEEIFTSQGKAVPLSSASAIGGEAAGSDLIMVTDVPDNFELIERIIRTLDQENAQINISIKFIETTLKQDEAMGINWSLRADTSLSFGLGELTNNSGNKVNLATLTPMTFAAMLQVLAEDAGTTLLQEPQVTTFNNSAATITVGTTIPVLVPQAEGSMFGAVPYTYQDQSVNVSLSVLPRINENELISMNIDAAVQAITGYVGAEQRPIVSNRTTTTNVMVKNGETLLIGGLIFDQDDLTVGKFPVLGDLPFIRKFFRTNSKKKSQNELLIFITPTIISS
ncbi:MAG: secretin and TonB N-terminal domain-containing protein [Candidatus Marinimicrobia bacterium]|nr:secretin and TonB N-terminal domain-containing protein [Candidatus Neomarinimicrobiota bacterium]